MKTTRAAISFFLVAIKAGGEFTVGAQTAVVVVEPDCPAAKTEAACIDLVEEGCNWFLSARASKGGGCLFRPVEFLNCKKLKTEEACNEGDEGYLDEGCKWSERASKAGKHPCREPLGPGGDCHRRQRQSEKKCHNGRYCVWNEDVTPEFDIYGRVTQSGCEDAFNCGPTTQATCLDLAQEGCNWFMAYNVCQRKPPKPLPCQKLYTEEKCVNDDLSKKGIKCYWDWDAAEAGERQPCKKLRPNPNPGPGPVP